MSQRHRAEAAELPPTEELRAHARGERHRIKGELLLMKDTADAAQAESSLQQALAVARDQQAKSWELRAALSMARMWMRHNRSGDARALLSPIYDWFTEGFDTPDLIEAKALLDQL